MRTALLFLCVLAAGCGEIVPPSPTQTPTPVQLPEGTITWNRDVEPIVRDHCVGCHTPGAIAPFSLETYVEAKPHAFAMAASTASRQMPPWMASDDCVPLRDARRLTAQQIAIIDAWAQGGAPEGEAVTPSAPEQKQQGLEWVDSTLTLRTPYTPALGVSDDYRCFNLPHGQATDRDIIGIDVQPGVRKMVHHVIVYAMDPAEAQAKDDAEPGEGWTCFAGPGTNPTMVGGWVPGTEATKYPAGTGITLEATKTLVIQVHYNVSAAGAQADSTALSLQFAQGRVAKPAQFTAMADWSFRIPPHAMGFETISRTPALASGTVWGVFPHMHTLGTKISVKKSGACLVDVPEWDFHWQQSFFFKDPQGLPFKFGEPIELKCTWDNPTDRFITWGEKTTDEMCLAYFYITK